MCSSPLFSRFVVGFHGAQSISCERVSLIVNENPWDLPIYDRSVTHRHRTDTNPHFRVWLCYDGHMKKT